MTSVDLMAESLGFQLVEQKVVQWARVMELSMAGDWGSSLEIR